MKMASWFLIISVFVGVLSAPTSLSAEKSDESLPHEVLIYKEASGKKLELWIFKPADWKATDQRSSMVFYHGGGWRGGSPTAFSRQATRLAELGMVGISVQYRLTSQEGVTMKDCVKDARSAFRWVRSHAAELGIDPTKIAAGGGSAGGHLAATLTTLDEVNDDKDDLKISTTPAALVLFNPACNLGFVKPGGSRREFNMENLLKLSPHHFLKAGHPPTLIMHGSEDKTVPIESVQEYAAKIRELGGSCEMSVFEGRAHSFFNRGPDYAESLKQMEGFLKKQNLLK
jgi:acetyl esterase